ncbi:MAG: hypothetical protein UY17_C0007G0001, partial [Candidatus Beckwithbacteria bacterium GW2011_GWC2_47_9]
MWNLLTQSYWRDEAFSVMLASHPLKDIFSLVVKLDHTPPFFYYLQHFWISAFGSGEIAARSLSLLFHLLTVYFGWKLTKSCLVGLAIFLNPFLWNYALEARHYSVYAALVLGGVYFYLAKKYTRSVAFWSLALLTHNFAWLYFLSFSVLYKAKKLLPALVIGAAWLPFAWQQISRLNQGMWLDPPSGWLWWLASFKAFTTTPLLTWLSLALLVLSLVRPKKLLLLAVAPPLLTYLISRFWVPIYLERYLLPTLPLLIVGAGLSLKQFKWTKYLATAYLLVLFVIFIQINQQTTKAPMRQVVKNIVSQIQPEEIIVTEQPINYLEVYYYLKQSGKENLLYSYLYPGEDLIPYYVGTDLIKPWQEIVGVPEGRPFWLERNNPTISIPVCWSWLIRKTEPGVVTVPMNVQKYAHP